MSTAHSPQTESKAANHVDTTTTDPEKTVVDDARYSSTEVDSLRKEDILALQDIDPALNAKMYLVNNVSWLVLSCYQIDIEL